MDFKKPIIEILADGFKFKFKKKDLKKVMSVFKGKE